MSGRQPVKPIGDGRAVLRSPPRFPRPGLTNDEVRFFLDWALFRGRFFSSAPSPVPWAARTAMSSALRAWRTRTSGLEFAGTLGIADHASGQFARIVVSSGRPPPEATERELSRADRLAAAVHAALTVLATRRALRRGVGGADLDGRRLARRFTKIVAAYAVLSVHASRRPNGWAALVCAADLSFDRMPYAFAASHAGVPLFLVFLDQPYSRPYTRMSVIPRSVLSGCIVHDLADADDAGIDASVPCALVEVPPRRRVVDTSALHVGIVVDRGVLPSTTVAVAVSAAAASNVERVMIRPHPGDVRGSWETAVAGVGQSVELAPVASIEQFAEQVDLCLVTITGALNRLARLGVPCWYIGEAIHRAPREPRDERVDDRTLRTDWSSERFAVPRAQDPFDRFLENLGVSDLESGPAPHGGDGGSSRRESTPIENILRAIEQLAPWNRDAAVGSGDGRPDGTRHGTA